MLKQIFRKIIIFILELEAKLILRKYKPKIIAVTGTVGKTSVKDAIATVLFGQFNVRKSEKSYNSELGVPLTIIGAKSGWNNPFLWILNILNGLELLIIRHDYPELLVLEMGVDRPNDMKKLVSWVKPDIGVISALGEVPVHIEYFKDPEHVAKEKLNLVKSLSPEKYAILNGDDNFIINEKEKIKANVLTYGFNEGNDLRASNYAITYKKEGEIDIPEGITFKVDYKGTIIPIYMLGVFGKQNVYSGLAALTVGISLDLNLVEMAQQISKYKNPPGRLKLIDGINNSFILDDTYNSSPVAVAFAIDVLNDIPSKRKIAVLGDMLELGKYTIEEHRKIGKMLKGVADIIFTVGPRSNFIVEEALNAKFKKSNIHSFSTSTEAAKKLKDLIQEGDLILVKGSQSMRMEKITEAIMSDPTMKSELLVRQEKEWLNK